MGLFNLFRKEKTEETSQENPLVLKREEILEWFREEFGGDITKAQEEALSIKQNLLQEFENIRKASEELDSAVFEGRERIHAAANMIKDSFVRRMYALTGNIKRASTETPSYSSINSFCKEAESTLKEMKSATPKQAALLSRYFEAESSAVISAIKSAEETLKGLEEYMSSAGNILAVSEKLEKMLADHDELIKKAADLQKKHSGLTKQFQEVEKEKKRLEKELSDIEKSDEWEQIFSLRERLEKKKTEMRKTGEALATILSPVRRPFKKLSHSYSAALSGEEQKCLKDCLESPVDMILSDNGVDTLRNLLNSVLVKHKSGGISLKPREHEKLKDILNSLDSDISSLRDRYFNLKNERETLEAMLRDSEQILSKHSVLEEAVKKKSKEAEELKIESGYALKQSERLLEEAEQKRKAIEDFLRKHAKRKITIAK